MDFIFGTVSSAVHTIVPFLVILSVVVFAHEFGHFWVARRCGVRVESFSIGFGKEIYGWTDRHGTRWKVAWLPLGGYVKMFGDTDPASSGVDPAVKAMSEEDKRGAFYAKSVGKRFAIVAAGPAANYVFAILVFALLFVFAGKPYTAPVIDGVVEGSAAEQAGLKIGDTIVSIDGTKTDSFETISRIIALNVGTPVSIVYERDGADGTVTATPQVIQSTDRLGGEHRLGRLGIMSTAKEYRTLSPGEAVVEAVTETWEITAATLRGVGQMIVGTRGTDELGGPLRIAEMSGKVATEGFLTVIWFIAVISINLGLINLFPVPLLDGGHLFFYLIEIARRRPLSERAQEIGSRIGGVLVASLMVFATWNDLVHLKVISYLRSFLS